MPSLSSTIVGHLSISSSSQALPENATKMNDNTNALNPTVMVDQDGTTGTVKFIGEEIIENANESSLLQGKTASKQLLQKQCYRMIALDLDGTLLQSNHQMADIQADYLRRLYVEEGIRICIATGRAPQSVYEHVQKLALPDPVPVVCSNGARGLLLSFNEKQHDDEPLQYCQDVFYTPVDRPVVEITVQLANKHGYCVQYYLDDVVYANPRTEEHRALLRMYEAITQCKIQVVEDDFAAVLEHQGLPSKMLVRFGDQKLQEAYQAYSEALLVSSSSSSSSSSDTQQLNHQQPPLATIIQGFIPQADWFLEILHPNVHKGNGLGVMCDFLKVPLTEVVAMGDGTNDVEFLTMAGWGVAMQNAQPVLKKVADATMEWTNDEHGVTKTIEQLKKEGRFVRSVSR